MQHAPLSSQLRQCCSPALRPTHVAQVRHAPQRGPDADVAQAVAAAVQVQHSLLPVGQQRQRGVAQQAPQARHGQQAGLDVGGQQGQDVLAEDRVAQQLLQVLPQHACGGSGEAGG